MRLIDADKLIEQFECNGGRFIVSAIVSRINIQPTIDIKTEVAREIFEEIYDIGDISIDKYDSLYLTLSLTNI